VTQSSGGSSINVDPPMRRGRHPCTGVVFISGKLQPANYMTNPQYPFIVVDKAQHIAYETLGPLPDPMPDHLEYYRKAHTYGDIHETGF